MGSWSIGHWIVVLIIVLVLFGANKIPRLMGDMAKGVKAFKQGLKDEDEAAAATPSAPPSQPQVPHGEAVAKADAAVSPVTPSTTPKA